jgi:hypothetical protein
MTSVEQSVDYEELLNRLNPNALRYLDLAGVSPPESARRKAALLASKDFMTLFSPGAKAWLTRRPIRRISRGS